MDIFLNALLVHWYWFIINNASFIEFHIFDQINLLIYTQNIFPISIFYRTSKQLKHHIVYMTIYMGYITSYSFSYDFVTLIFQSE